MDNLRYDGELEALIAYDSPKKAAWVEFSLDRPGSHPEALVDVEHG